MKWNDTIASAEILNENFEECQDIQKNNTNQSCILHNGVLRHITSCLTTVSYCHSKCQSTESHFAERYSAKCWMSFFKCRSDECQNAEYSFVKYHYAKPHVAKCFLLCVIMLKVNVLSVILLMVSFCLLLFCQAS